jgi:hypothetical protein
MSVIKQDIYESLNDYCRVPLLYCTAFECTHEMNYNCITSPIIFITGTDFIDSKIKYCAKCWCDLL